MQAVSGKVAVPSVQPESFKFTQKVMEEVREID
jgi:hypothetical protein